MTDFAGMGLVRGALTLILFISFLSLWVWAWSKRRREDFTAAALLPLHDDPPATDRSAPR
jgi:cytochrome c oxidase cbb3-type subunit 4